MVVFSYAGLLRLTVKVPVVLPESPSVTETSATLKVGLTRSSSRSNTHVPATGPASGVVSVPLTGTL